MSSFYSSHPLLFYCARVIVLFCYIFSLLLPLFASLVFMETHCFARGFLFAGTTTVGGGSRSQGSSGGQGLGLDGGDADEGELEGVQ